MNGVKLAGALVVIALLTLVVPPIMARQVHQRRISAAHADVARIAEELAAVGHGAMAGRLLRGPGELPKSAPDVRWLAGVPVAPLPALEHAVGADPWGNFYVALVGSEGQGSVVVVSAGPNGVIETQLGGALPPTPSGDDIVGGQGPGIGDQGPGVEVPRPHSTPGHVPILTGVEPPVDTSNCAMSPDVAT